MLNQHIWFLAPLISLDANCASLTTQLTTSIANMDRDLDAIAHAFVVVDNSTPNGQARKDTLLGMFNDVTQEKNQLQANRANLAAFQTTVHNLATQAIADITMFQFFVPDAQNDGGGTTLTEYDEPDDIEQGFIC